MKKNHLFIVLAIYIMAMPFSTANAQVYDSDVHYYIKSGESISSHPNIYMIKSNEDYVAIIDNKNWSWVKSKLREDEDYFDRELGRKMVDPKNCYAFNSSMSNSKQDVYEKPKYENQFPYYNGIPCYGLTPTKVRTGSYICVFSSDMSVMILCTMNKSGDIVGSKRYYVEIDKSEIMPKASNNDFF